MPIVIYCDGSYLSSKSQKGVKTPPSTLSWGVVALYDDAEHESYGKYVGFEGKGLHEVVAFFEAVLVAHNGSFAPKDTSIYTDSQEIAALLMELHPTPYNDPYTHPLMKRMVRHYNKEVIQIIIEYVLNARIQYIFGQQRGFYHNRADYLARYARRIERNLNPLHSIEKWSEWQREPWFGPAGKWIPAFGHLDESDQVLSQTFV